MSEGPEHNRRAWDQRALRQDVFARPVEEHQFDDPLSVLDSQGWLGDVRARRVLCLGAGGGRQGPLFATAGAVVTVVDISGEMLALDRALAARRSLALETVQTSMDDLSMFAPEAFDIVAQPVSSCYVADVMAVYREVARVLVPGGVYVSQHKQPSSLQADVEPTAEGFLIRSPYYAPGPLAEVVGSRHRESGTLEFLHRWEQLVGGLCRSGFVVEDLIEPYLADAHAEAGSFAARSCYLPPYVRIKARRTGEPAAGGSTPQIWSP